jgi:hypothetical protein
MWFKYFFYMWPLQWFKFMKWFFLYLINNTFCVIVHLFSLISLCPRHEYSWKNAHLTLNNNYSIKRNMFLFIVFDWRRARNKRCWRFRTKLLFSFSSSTLLLGCSICVTSIVSLLLFCLYKCLSAVISNLY